MKTPPSRKLRLAGKTALVTGAARRLGHRIALSLAEEGVHVIAHYCHSQDQAEELVTLLKQRAGRAWALQADLSESAQADALLESARVAAGPIDFLINNASIFETETLWQTTSQSLQQNMEIHAYAPLALARQFARQDRPGQIVNILDSRVNDYDREHVAYHLSKRTLQALTRVLAVELAPAIQVNAVAPGLILPPEGEGDDYLQRLAHTNPMNCWGHPQDIADAVCFLLQSRFTTGQTLYVDGGRNLRGRIYE
jgi:NAD(P)-dependent dehydrogenase (short-subunit alcohol dehydrogenase family)